MAHIGQHTDVIFVVEGTALCGAYLHELRSQYIIPTLEYFSGPIDEKDCGSDSNYCLYGLVVFHAADALPGVLIDTFGPLNTSYKLLCQVDRIKFNGGHGEAMSSVAEGLAAAMECLEDLTSFRNTVTDAVAKKHIILVCNCKPYGIPVSGSEGIGTEYIGKTVEELAADMVEKEIHLSIMSPRKVPSLIQLFDQAGGDIVNQKGYSRDVRHLILLNGFNLKVNDERPPTPPRINQENFTMSTIAPPHVQQQQNPNTTTTSIQLPVTTQQSQPIMSNVQNPNPAISQQSPMMQLPRSPVSSTMAPTMGVPNPQLAQQNSPMGAGMQSPSNAQLQQANMAQLSQQQAMQIQQQQQQQMQQQMFQQQQQPFRNPRPMTSPAQGQVPTSRGAMMTPQHQQQQMNQHLQMNQQQVGPQQHHLNKLQQQFQQQQQQQAQLQNIAMQQQNLLQQQQNQAQNQNQQITMQQGQMQGMHPQQQQQQQNQLQQNLMQQQQAQMQQQQGQGQMLQQGQNPMQQQQNPMLQGQTPLLQQQNPQMNIIQPGQTMVGQQQGAPHMQQQQQQSTATLQQQGQMPLQQQQPGSQLSMSPGPRWPAQMNQQQMQMQMSGQQPRMQAANQIPPHPQPTSSPLQRPPQEIIARLNQPPMAGSPGAPNTNPAGVNNLQQQLGSPTLQRERRIIWNGFVEWHEKQKGTPEGLKIPRQVPCHVSSTVVNNEPEVKGDGWPSKLIMQLIPKQIVGNLGGTYFLDVKTVLFILQPCEALVSLTKVMDSGFAGCVHFTGSGMPQNACTIKVLILLYSKERNAYLGFIPNDQAGFVDRIRKVIQQQKTQQAAIRQGPGIPPSIPQAFTGPGMQGGMVIQGQGAQQQQQSSPGLPVSVQQMSSQPQMMSNPSQLQQQLGGSPQIPAPDNTELERQQNALRIQQLKQALEQAQAQQRELNYNQQLQSTQGPGPGQMMNQPQIGGQGPMTLPNQMGNPGQIPGQGQMQPGQMMAGQGMRPGMAPQRMQQGPGGQQMNTRLKHLLQQPGSNVGPGAASGFNTRMRMPAQGQQNQLPQQQPPGSSFHEDLGILDLLK